MLSETPAPLPGRIPPKRETRGGHPRLISFEPPAPPRLAAIPFADGWPRVLKPFASEAWRRAEAGELDDEELFACDAPWAGLFVRFTVLTQEEYERRLQIAAEHGEPLNA